LRSWSSRSNGESRAATGEGLVQQCGVDPPLAAEPLDDRRLAGPADVERFDRGLGRPSASDAERAQPALVTTTAGLVGRDHLVVGVDPGREVPQLVAALAPGHGDLAALHHQAEQHQDVAVVVPSRGPPGPHGGVGQLALRQRPVGTQPVEDVAATGIVRPDPLDLPLLPLLERAGPRPLGHLGAVEGEVLGRPDRAAQLDHSLLGERVLELDRLVRRPETAPQHEIGTRGDRLRGLELEQGEPAYDVVQVCGPLRGQGLGPDGDPARVGARELVDGAHAVRLRHVRPETAGQGGGFQSPGDCESPHCLSPANRCP